MAIFKKLFSLFLVFAFLAVQCILPDIPTAFAEEPDTEAPSIPCNISADRVTENSAAVRWEQSDDNVAVAAYDVYRDYKKVGTTNEVSFEDGGLFPDTTYIYTIKARDAEGNVSEASEPLRVTTNPSSDTTPPSAPSNLIPGHITDTSVELIWDESTDDTGVIGYEIYSVHEFVYATHRTDYVVTGLTPETGYTFSVRAKDAAGNISEASNELVVNTAGEDGTTAPPEEDTEEPSGPEDLTLTFRTSASVGLSWGAAADNIGVEAYDIYEGGTIVSSTEDTACTISELNSSTEYSFTVKARDAAGNVSQPSNTLKVKTLMAAPGNVTASPTTVSINVAWDTIDGAESYDIEADGHVIDNGTGTAFLHGSLLSDTRHTYRARGRDSAGAGEWSEPLTVSTKKLLPPENITVTQTFTSITLSWDSVEEAIEYEIEADGLIVSNTTDRSYTHRNLAINTPHEYRIRAVNSGGRSEWSELIRVNTVSYGTGTEDDPYLVMNVDELNNIRNNTSAHYKLYYDLDLGGVSWEPIGTKAAPFTGSLDGNGHTISNLVVSKASTDNVGLFGYLNNAAIKNTGIDNAEVAGKSYTGALVGYAAGTSTLEGCTVTGEGTVAGASYVGGLAGYIEGTVEGCSSEVNVSSTGGYAGGLLGKGGTLTRKSYATGSIGVTGERAGGLVGFLNVSGSKISECYATGDVSAVRYAGGLLGYTGSNTVSIYDCFSTGNVTASHTSNGYAGGLAGVTGSAQIKNCYSIGKVTAAGTNRGGLMGSGSNIAGSYYDGVASGYIPQKAEDVSRLTSGMKIRSRFDGWDFDTVWTIEEGLSYPYLRSLDKPQSVSEGMPVGDAAGGLGTADDPYIIVTKEQMNNIRYELSGNYRLGEDIDLSGVSWEPLGIRTAPFTGSLDGNGHTISNLVVSKASTDNVGLFGYLNNAAIKNISIDNAEVAGKSYTGALVGYAAGTSSLEGCTVTGEGTVAGASYVGGLAGYIEGTVEGCSSEVNVSSTGGYAGGLLGTGGTLTRKSYATGSIGVTGERAGGLVGFLNISGSKISECYATGDVSAVRYAGGLLGYTGSNTVSIYDCFSTGNVTASHTSNGYAGGLAGVTGSAQIKNCYSIGKVTAAGTNQGGLVGSGSNIAGSYFDSLTTGRTTPAAQARTTEQLQQQATFTGWDFSSVWDIIEGQSYPTLRGATQDTYLPVPTRLKATSLTETSITLIWMGTGEAVSFDIEVDGMISDNGLSSDYLHTGLLPGTRHTYRVRQVYPAGVSGWSSPLTVTTRLITPANITALPGITTITLSWEPVAPEITYDVEADGRIIDTAADCSFTDTGLMPETSHTYRVRAKNSTGVSGWSDAITAVTLAVIFDSPKNLRAAASDTTILVEWDAAREAVSYDIEIDNSQIVNLLETSFLHSGLLPKTTHYYRVRANYVEGTSEWSFGLEVTTLGDFPGSGTPGDPYIIKTAEQMRKVANDLSACYRLAGDIDLGNEEWTPIGTNSSAPFTGIFDGNGFTIRNLKISKPTTDNIGLFGYVENTAIKNVIIENVDIEGIANVGTLVGYAAGASGIENCSVTGNGIVSGYGLTGGLVGNASGSSESICTISRSSSKVNVSSIGAYTGGLAGRVAYTNISYSYAAGSVSSSDGSFTGGLVGAGISSPTIKQSYAVGNVTGATSSGGLAGYLSSTVVENCYALGEVAATSSFPGYTGGAGGLIGAGYSSTMVNSYSTGLVTANGPVGGLIGYSSTCTVTNSYYDGIASGHIPQKEIDYSRLTSGMKAKATFNGWDFMDIWSIDEGNSYPYLKGMDKPSMISEGLPVNDVAGGIGTADVPYIISTEDQLHNVKYDLEGCYRLAGDIDLGNEEWMSIGTNSSAPFTGIFDGNGFAIRNLKISKPTTDNIGFFGYVENTVIKNVTIENVDIEGKDYVGTLVGYAAGASGIENCSISGTGTVSGKSYAGGLIGIASGSTESICTISRSCSKVNVTSTGDYTGGLAGRVVYTDISYSYAIGSVSSEGSYTGGLIGHGSRAIKQSYAVGNVTGATRSGGLAGYLISATVENCYALGEVAATSSSSGYAGGLTGAGYSSTMVNSYSAGRITANGTSAYVGGLVGYSSYYTITNSYYDGIASGHIPQKEVDYSRLTSGMKTKATFNGWDFTDIWSIDEGNSYPYLKGMDKPSMVSEGLPVNDVAGGSGTASVPYIISTEDQLNNVKYDLEGCYRLAGDIDLGNEEWTSIGTNSSAPFTGIFDGNGFAIRNLKISKPTTDNIGFFGYVENTVIKNVTIENVDIEGKDYVGTLVGYAAGASGIENCSISGTGTVSGKSYAGGLIGIASGSTESICTISRSSSKVNVTSTGAYTGGLAGRVAYTNISYSYAAGSVSSEGSYTGGLIGHGSRAIKQSYAVGNVTGATRSGGLAGYLISATVENCYALGEVAATSSSSGYAGGLIGAGYSSTMVNSYSAGRITANGTSGYVGGIVGYSSTCTVTNSYFDSTTTERTTPAEQARTTEQLMQQATFGGWDFSGIWDIEEGISYPYLKLLSSPVGLAATDITETSVTICWRNIPDALGYDLSVDGVVIDNGLSTDYIHESLLPGTRHIYKVRSRSEKETSDWSPELAVLTVLAVPQNAVLSVSGAASTVTWDAVSGAGGYDVEIDGITLDAGAAIAYTHEVLLPNTQHTYRVRAKTSDALSKWTGVMSAVHWSATPGICLAAVDFSTAPENIIEVQIKANNFSSLYTAQFELEFDPEELEPDTADITNLIWPDDPNAYVKYTVYLETGKIKILASQTGNEAGKEGQFDILSLKFRQKTSAAAPIKVNLARTVDPSGTYIEIPEVQTLNLRTYPNS